MPDPKIKVNASLMPIAERALGIAESLINAIVSYANNTERRADKKAIVWGKKMAVRIKEAGIEDETLQRYAGKFISYLD